MSWLFSRALVEAFFLPTCSDGERLRQLRTTDMPQAYWSPDKTTEVCQRSQFGMTCGLLTESLGADVSMSYLAAFPARTSAGPVKVPESAEKEAGCGNTWPASLARYDRDSRSLKTAQTSLIEDSISSSPILP